MTATPKEKERIETLLTVADHALGILAHKKLSPNELGDYRKMQAYVKALRDELRKEAGL